MDISPRTLGQLFFDALSTSRVPLILATGLLVVLFLGTNAVWGLTETPDETLLSGWMASLAPLAVWSAGLGGFSDRTILPQRVSARASDGIGHDEAGARDL